MVRHLLLEVLCDCNDKKKMPQYCKKIISTKCVEKSCPHASYSACHNEIAYVGNNGITESLEHWIGFGGDMEPNLDEYGLKDSLVEEWKNICVNKINEAYEEFLLKKSELGKK